MKLLRSLGKRLHQITPSEQGLGRANINRHYFDCFELAQRNFAPYPNAVLVRGRIPETLIQIQIDRVAYLSIDMNIVYPEIAAMRHFWDRLVPGALVLLDDYAFRGHEEQKTAMDEFARSKGCEILTVPTGQGLLIKPPDAVETERSPSLTSGVCSLRPTA